MADVPEESSLVQCARKAKTRRKTPKKRKKKRGGRGKKSEFANEFRKIRGRVHLPENWEHIVLDKKAIEKIHSRGINYQQARMRSGGVVAPDG